MIPNMIDNSGYMYDGHMSLQYNILCNIKYKWNELFKEEIRMWAQIEYGFCSK